MALIACPECKKEISTAAQTCPNCGYALVPRMKWNRGVAALLSLVIPGAGQISQGRILAGVLWLVGVVGGYLFGIYAGVSVFLGLFLHLACIVSIAVEGDPYK